MASADCKFECSFCLERFKDPRILTCFHSFCHDCLEDYVTKFKKTENSVDKFDCPVCRATVILPVNGVDGLQKNFYLDLDTNKPSRPMCGVHKDEDLRFYCRNCSEQICRDCKIVSHEGHTADMTDDVATEMRTELEELLNDTEKAINENEIRQRAVVETDLGSLETTLAMVEINAGMMKNEIEKLFVFTKNLLTPLIKSKKKKAFTIQSTYSDRLMKLDEHKQLFAEGEIFQVHKKVMDQKKEITKLREPELSFSSEVNDAESVDNTKLVNMVDQLRDSLRQQITKFKETSFVAKRKTESASGKRIHSSMEGVVVPVKKQKESEKDSTHKRRLSIDILPQLTSKSGSPVFHRSHSEVFDFSFVSGSTDSAAFARADPVDIKRSKLSDTWILDWKQKMNDWKMSTSASTSVKDSIASTSTDPTVKDTIASTSTDSTGKSSAGAAKSLFDNLARAYSTSRPTHQVKPVVSDTRVDKTLKTDLLTQRIKELQKHNIFKTVNDDKKTEGNDLKPKSKNRFELKEAQVKLKSGSKFEDGQKYLVTNQNGEKLMMSYKGGKLVELPENFRKVDGAKKDGTVIDPTKVELTDGGTFKEGEIYLVKDPTGKKKKMVFGNGQLIELSDNSNPANSGLKQCLPAKPMKRSEPWVLGPSRQALQTASVLGISAKPCVPVTATAQRPIATPQNSTAQPRTREQQILTPSVLVLPGTKPQTTVATATLTGNALATTQTRTLQSRPQNVIPHSSRRNASNTISTKTWVPGNAVTTTQTRTLQSQPQNVIPQAFRPTGSTRSDLHLSESSDSSNDSSNSDIACLFDFD